MQMSTMINYLFNQLLIDWLDIGKISLWRSSMQMSTMINHLFNQLLIDWLDIVKISLWGELYAVEHHDELIS